MSDKSEFSVEDDVRFPPELVGRPTSEVLRHLAKTFGACAQDLSGGEEATAGVRLGYLYAELLLHNWAADADDVEGSRCNECVDCLTPNITRFQFTPSEDADEAYYCVRCSHTVYRH